MSSNHLLPLIVSSPSGAGKTTLTRALRTRIANLAFSVSHTTRPPRPGEKEGVDYHFVDDRRFDRMVREGRFPLAGLTVLLASGLILLALAVPALRRRAKV